MPLHPLLSVLLEDQKKKWDSNSRVSQSLAILNGDIDYEDGYSSVRTHLVCDHKQAEFQNFKDATCSHANAVIVRLEEAHDNTPSGSSTIHRFGHVFDVARLEDIVVSRTSTSNTLNVLGIDGKICCTDLTM